MSLRVYERQETKTWYELTGNLEACKLFPALLPNSQSVNEDVEDIQTESEVAAGRYDGYDASDDVMEDEIAEFTKSAIAGFHDEALTAAKIMLTALKTGETLLRRNFEDEEVDILEEAAKVLSIALPWDPVEAAQIAKDEAEAQARSIVYAQKELALAQALLDETSTTGVERLREGRTKKLESARQELERLKGLRVTDAEAEGHTTRIWVAQQKMEERRRLLDGTADEQERLRKDRVQRVDNARRALESLMAGVAVA